MAVYDLNINLTTCPSVRYDYLC